MTVGVGEKDLNCEIERQDRLRVCDDTSSREGSTVRFFNLIL